MTKRYREPLESVEVDDDTSPRSFSWRGRRYEVLRVLGHWREDAGWWNRPDGQPIRIQQADLWRVETRRSNGGRPSSRGVYELVCRAGAWHLDRIWD